MDAAGALEELTAQGVVAAGIRCPHGSAVERCRPSPTLSPMVVRCQRSPRRPQRPSVTVRYASAMTTEYTRVPWDRVNEMAAEGWRLVLIPPVPEMKAVLGQLQMGELLFAMEREAPEAGQAAQQNRAGEAGRSLWSGTGGESR
jgi:hypothetical protein